MATTDLVLEGGGVKGAGLAGAVGVLARDHDFHRVAGTSAGAIVAAFVAAGLVDDLERLTIDTDFAEFLDEGVGGRFLGPIGNGPRRDDGRGDLPRAGAAPVAARPPRRGGRPDLGRPAAAGLHARGPRSSTATGWW